MQPFQPRPEEADEKDHGADYYYNFLHVTVCACINFLLSRILYRIFVAHIDKNLPVACRITGPDVQILAM